MNFQDWWNDREIGIDLKELEKHFEEIANSNSDDLLKEYLADMLKRIYGEPLTSTLASILHYNTQHSMSEAFVLHNAGNVTEMAGHLPAGYKLIIEEPKTEY